MKKRITLVYRDSRSARERSPSGEPLAVPSREDSRHAVRMPRIRQRAWSSHSLLSWIGVESSQ